MFNGYHIHLSQLGFLDSGGGYTKNIAEAMCYGNLTDANEAAAALQGFLKHLGDMNVQIIQTICYKVITP